MKCFDVCNREQAALSALFFRKWWLICICHGDWKVRVRHWLDLSESETADLEACSFTSFELCICRIKHSGGSGFMKHIETKLPKDTPACNCIPCWLETSQQIIHFSFRPSFSLVSVHQIIFWMPGSMWQRTVVMYVEIGCFVTCLCGWILICSTLATEYWTFSEVSSVVLTTGNFFSNLWMDCVSDTTGVSDCKYYPSMMNLSGKKTISLCYDLIVDIKIHLVFLTYFYRYIYPNTAKKQTFSVKLDI